MSDDALRPTDRASVDDLDTYAEDDGAGPDEGEPFTDDENADQAVEEAEARVEADIDLAQVVAERDDYLDALRRLQADFANYKKQTVRRDTERVERASEMLAQQLLPVLDAFEGALGHDESRPHVGPIYDALMGVLEKEGLAPVYPAGEVFDPNLHEAVAHEEGDGDEDGLQVVAGVLRTGYLWRGRVLRPAMVRVRG